MILIYYLYYNKLKIMSIKKLKDEVFLSLIGEKIGGGYQGSVYNFEKNKAVKIRNITKNNDKKDIYNEYHSALLASNIKIGPKIYDARIIDNKAYMVQEKITPIKLKQENQKEIVKLFKKAISNNLVNYDGGFGITAKNKIVLYDYGTSYITNSFKQTVTDYLDYFYSFADFHNVNGLYELIEKYAVENKFI
jgi:hypothetical protein